MMLPPMGGRAKDLFFQYDKQRDQIHVWRASGKPDFWVGAKDFKTICQRYHFCLANNLVPLPNQLGGTAQFNNPKWPHPPLGTINTPFVAPIIRHVFQHNAHLASPQPCC
jgi:hypothetical protein